MAPKVAIIILNWNGYRDTLECLGSLSESAYENREIVVVDNGSTDGSAERIPDAYPVVTMLRNRENLGFAEGNNVGLMHAMKRDADFMLLLNNDAVVSKTMLNQLIQVAEEDPRIGILGPQIYFRDNPDTIESAGARVNLLTGRLYHVNHGRKGVSPYTGKTRDVDMISGCAMLVRKEVIDRIGYLDPLFFCYMEDADYCVRARNAGYRVVNVPLARVRHKGGGSLRGYASPIRIYYGARNHLFLVEKNLPLRNQGRRWLRRMSIILFHLLFVCLHSPVPKRIGLMHLRRGVEDFFRGKMGSCD